MELVPNFLEPFNVRQVQNNHNYIIVDAVGNFKSLYHDQLRPCPAPAPSVR